MIDMLLPGSFPAFIVGLLIGVALLFGRDRLRWWGRLWLTLVTLLYAALSTHVGAGLFSAPLHRFDTFITTAAQANGATAVVMLQPGAWTFRSHGMDMSEVPMIGVPRFLEATRIYKLLGTPWVIVQGGTAERTDRPSIGDIARDTLVRLGVPAERIIIESQSLDTHEHTLRLRPILAERGIQRFVLVTSSIHMPRSASAFRKAGYDFVSSAASATSDLKPLSGPLWPRTEHLGETLAASHEYVGLFYYWIRGWR